MLLPLRQFGNHLLDVLFPRNCLGCHNPVGEGLYRYLCKTCVRTLSFIQPPCCECCGIDFDGDVLGPRLCHQCTEAAFAFSFGRSAFRLTGLGRKLIHTLKYEEGLHVLPDLAALSCAPLGFLEFLEGAVLVPVPLHKRKERERGLNQSALIAQWLVRQAAGASLEACLIRKKDTPSQTRLTREERAQNVRGAFALKPNCLISKEKRYVLVDDVFTTGATLNACAHVLRRAGAHQVDVVTLGHG